MGLYQIINNFMETTKFVQPKTSTNQLCDIIDWLKLGCIVTIYNRYGKYKIYHNKCLESNNNVSECQIICVNCETFPDLLEEGEWPYYIENYPNNKCSCENILNKINDLRNKHAPNVFNFTS